jgi:predicted RecA/RadA family phage recombinase
MKKFLAYWVCWMVSLLGQQNLLAQTTFKISGKIIDGDSAHVLGKATVSVASIADTTQKRLFSANEQGIFTLPAANGQYLLEFSFTGYDASKKKVTVAGSNVDLGEVLMFKKQKTLGDVVVVGKTPPARQKGDTTELNAAAFKVNPDGTVEDLLRKAPGVTIENGQVIAQGEQVQRITIDGREFFGNDAAAALRNLPAEIVEKIQVFDRMSDQAQLTGVSDGNEVKAINIVTKANMRNGQFGRVYAGYGTNDRYAAGGNVNIFDKNRRINILGLFNNVNQQNFSDEDLLGVNAQANQGNRGGGRGGGGGGRPGGWGGGGGNFFVGQQPGIATTNAIGINFSDLWANKKMEVTGSYFFNNSRTDAASATRRQTFLGDTSQFYNQVNTSITNNYNHRFNARLEYKIDSNNTLIVVPNISFQQNERLNDLTGVNTTAGGDTINSTRNRRNTLSNGYNIRNEITYRRGFTKKGRSFSINLNTAFSKRNLDARLDAFTSSQKLGLMQFDTLLQRTDNQSDGTSLSTNITYSEPLGKIGLLQFNYNPQLNLSRADQRNLFFDKSTNDYTRFDTLQSNLFDNKTTIQNAGITYRIGEKGDFSVGLNFQHTRLESDQTFPLRNNINLQFSNILPNLSYRKDFNKQSNLRIRYRASVNTPSINQLQNVVNISNPLFLSSGNANLVQSYNHFVFARYGYTNTPKGKSFFAGIFAQQVNDFITNGTWLASKDSLIANGILLRQGAQFTKPINLSGYWSIRSFATYGITLKAIKSNLNLSAGVGYVRTPGAVNNQKNFTNNTTYNAGVTLASNISEYIDFTLSYNGNFNNASNSLNATLNNRFYFHTAGVKLNLLTKSGWFVLNDVNNQLYSGLADGFNQDFWLWNLSLGKKFLEKQRGELKFTVFDLLKQNQSISRSVEALYIEDVQTQVLRQYFMLTFTYTLRNFGKPATNGRANTGGNSEIRNR